MSGFNTHPAELYKLGSKATVITEGLAFVNQNDAALKIVNGTVKATKFGVYQVGPSSVQMRREDYERSDGDLYDVAEQDTQVTIYFDNTDYYVESTITRIFTQDEFAVYDSETDTIYRIEYDDRNDSEINLIGTDTRTVQKVEHNTFENELGGRYTPLVKINRSR